MPAEGEIQDDVARSDGIVHECRWVLVEQCREQDLLRVLFGTGALPDLVHVATGHRVHRLPEAIEQPGTQFADRLQVLGVGRLGQPQVEALDASAVRGQHSFEGETFLRAPGRGLRQPVVFSRSGRRALAQPAGVVPDGVGADRPHVVLEDLRREPLVVRAVPPVAADHLLDDVRQLGQQDPVDGGPRDHHRLRPGRCVAVHSGCPHGEPHLESSFAGRSGGRCAPAVR